MPQTCEQVLGSKVQLQNPIQVPLTNSANGPRYPPSARSILSSENLPASRFITGTAPLESWIFAGWITVATRKSKRISTTICSFFPLIFLPPSIPHSLPFWWEVRTLLWVYDTKTRRFSANRIFEPNLLANTSALQRLLLISNFENESRLFATEWNLWGAFAIGTPFLLCTVGYTKSLGEDFFRCLSRGSNRFFILFHCLSVRLVGYSLITLILPTIELERIFRSVDRYRSDSFPTPFSLLVRESLRASSNKFKTSSKA